jgi:tellurite resistance protein
MASFEDTIPKVSPISLLTVNREVKLDLKKTLDLIIISQNPQLQALWDLMEMEIIVARDIAMSVDPSKKDEQSSAMTVAHAMMKFYESIRQRITYLTTEHLNEVKRLDMEKKLGSPEEIERIIMNQITNELESM